MTFSYPEDNHIGENSSSRRNGHTYHFEAQNSLHTEAGKMAGADKRVITYIPEMIESELRFLVTHS